MEEITSRRSAGLVAWRKALHNECTPSIFLDPINMLSCISDSMLVDFTFICRIDLGHDLITGKSNITYIRSWETSKNERLEAQGETGL